jgi:hypothetical protein
MALWGVKDDVYSGGTIDVDYSTKVVTGTGTTFSALTVGDVILIGAGATFGEAVVSGITSETQISIASTQYLNGDAISGEEWTASQRPKYLAGDSHWGINEVFGVDNDEVGLARTTIYSVDHGGWVGIVTYTDSNGRVRTKSEVFVAMGRDANGFGGITSGIALTTGEGGDAADDTFFPE